MAKGKISLKDTVPDNEIIRNGEVKNQPNYPFPDGVYGITGKYNDYSLVKKRIAYRTGTEEDGIYNGKVIEYEVYEDVPCYSTELTHLFDAYAKILNLTEFKTKKMKGEIGELIEIHQRTHNMISEALKGIDTYLSNEQKEVCNLADTKQRLLDDNNEIHEIKNKSLKVFAEITRMYNEIKQAHTIIVDRDKPKKHRMPKEEE